MQSHGLNLYLHLERIKKFRNVTNMTETLAKTFPVTVVTETGSPDSVTGKVETLGSNFSNETRISEAACVVATFEKS